MDDARKLQEVLIADIAITSRDRRLRVEDFRSLFRFKDEFQADGMDCQTEALWLRLFDATQLLRANDGVSFDQLMVCCDLSSSEVRQCIRVLINLGGEVEIVSSPDSRTQLFKLHN